jgi:hypothetical protein
VKAETATIHRRGTSGLRRSELGMAGPPRGRSKRGPRPLGARSIRRLAG